MRRVSLCCGGLVSCLLVAACAADVEEPMPAAAPQLTDPAPPAAAPANPEAAATWTQALADLDARIAHARSLSEAQPESWMRVDSLAKRYLSRAQLSGDLDDYGRAQALVASAFELAPEGSGPFLTRASVNYSLHRLPLVGADLERAGERLLVDERLRADLLRRRGDVDFQSGRYDQAVEGFEASLALRPSFSALCDLAQARRRAGDYQSAEALYDRAEGLFHGGDPRTGAWLQLQRAILDLDRYKFDSMLGHLDDADAAMSGWWLVDEHRAEALALMGRGAEARVIYDRVIADTGKPEYMDAVAKLLRAKGETEAAAAEAEAAARLYEDYLEEFPEAAVGHALRHYLDFGPADRALELARANAALRPNGEALIQLAEALLLNDQLDAARAQIEAVMDSTWVSLRLYTVAESIYEAAGESELAARQRAAAEAFKG